jgi:hypothetical protein
MKSVLRLIALGLCILTPRLGWSELADGEVLSNENWQQAEGMLPPEILDHYKRGDYSSMVADASLPKYVPLTWPRELREATEANIGKYEIGPEGNIVDKQGNPAGFLYGVPFPKIDANDPQAARKIVWNYYYNRWYDGNGHFFTNLAWLSRSGGLERNLIVDARFLYYQGWKDAQSFANPLNLLLQTKSTIVEPADVNGTSTLGWRFRDASKRDQNWAFVPALRRVRQVSPANRSDGVLGSDLAEDDGQYFDAKPEDFDFRLLGEEEMYGLVDGKALDGATKITTVPGGGYRFIWDDDPWFVYDKPGAPGVPWGPMQSRLVKGKYWVIEAIPRDRYYLFGKIILRFNQENMRGSFSSKYSWKGELLNAYQVQNGIYWSPDGGHTGLMAGRSVYQVAENIKMDRATVVRFDRRAGTPADYQIPLDPAIFESTALVQMGK